MSAQTTSKAQGQSRSSRTVSSPSIKFMIGFIAGWCAASFPRLAAMMAGSDAGGALALFTVEYLLLSGVFSIVIGFVVMIMEWHVSREPKATFMMAIGIPALLTGSFNGLTGVQKVNDQQEKISALISELSTSQGIPINDEPLGDFTVIDGSAHGPQSSVDPWLWLGISPANAAAMPPPQVKQVSDEGFNPGYKVMEPLYYISLGSAPNKQLAMTMVRDIQLKVKTATAVKTSDGYKILAQLQPLPKSDAILQAARLKKQDFAAQLIPAGK